MTQLQGNNNKSRVFSPRKGLNCGQTMDPQIFLRFIKFKYFVGYFGHFTWIWSSFPYPRIFWFNYNL